MNSTESKRNKPELYPKQGQELFPVNYQRTTSQGRHVKPSYIRKRRQSFLCNLPKPVKTEHLSPQFMLGETLYRSLIKNATNG